MAPFAVFEDDRVRVSAILVPHGPVFPLVRLSVRHRRRLSGVQRGHPGLTTTSSGWRTGAAYLVHEVLDLEFYEQLGHARPRCWSISRSGDTLTTE